MLALVLARGSALCSVRAALLPTMYSVQHGELLTPVARYQIVVPEGRQHVFA